MAFLASLLEGSGHEVLSLTCSSDLPTCYNQEAPRSLPTVVECSMCRLSNLNGFAGISSSTLGAFVTAPIIPVEKDSDWRHSSASTLGRFESDEDFEGDEFQEANRRLAGVPTIGFRAAAAWIERNQIDALLVFNGRIDVTRGIFEAGLAANIPTISMERATFGDGIKLQPGENCIGLKSNNRIVKDFSSRCLTGPQAATAAMTMTARLDGTANGEWRRYGQSRSSGIKDKKIPTSRILFLPGSRNETFGHADRTSEWSHPTDAIDRMIEMGFMRRRDLLVRFHPGWIDPIRGQSGEKPIAYYRDWCERKGINYLTSGSPVSTYDLIDSASVVLTAGSSAGVDAAFLGKAVVLIGAADYEEAGFTYNARSYESLAGLGNLLELRRDSRAQIRQALRFVYSASRRVPQYVNEVSALSSSKFRYQASSAARLERMISTGQLEPDDPVFSRSGTEERELVEQLLLGTWESGGAVPNAEGAEDFELRRKGLWRVMDFFRSILSVRR